MAFYNPKKVTASLIVILILMIAVFPFSRSIVVALIDATGIMDIGKPLQAEISNNGSFTYSMKTWKIKFNQQINMDTINDNNAYILGDDNKKLKVSFLYSKFDKTLSIIPAEKYKAWSSYNLYITNGITAQSGKILQNPIRFNFDMMNNTYMSAIGENFEKSIADGIAEDDEDYYNEIKYAMEHFKYSLKLTLKNCDKYKYPGDVFETVTDICNYIPLINYGFKSVKTSSYLKNSTTKILDISFEYYLSAEKMSQMKLQSAQKAQEIVTSLITPQMTEWQKELAIHDYVINSSKYDKQEQKNLPIEVYTDFGILINKIAVCDGYAKAMYRLLNLVGVDCIYVTGNTDSLPHAWNIVKIGGGYYQVDTTWDDSLFIDNQQMLIHKFFNVTDREIKGHHTWEMENYPQCVASEFSGTILNPSDFLGNNSYVYDVQNYSDFYNGIKDAIVKKRIKATFKILKYDKNLYDVEKTVKKVVSQSAGAHFLGSLSFTSSYDLREMEMEYVEILFKRL